MPRWSPFEPYFKSMIDTSGDCWLWMGGKDSKGYGRVWRDGRRQGTHRVSYELSIGPIPDGLYICHHCDNKLCARPSHLFLGTQKDNMQDWTKKGKNILINDPSLLKRGDDHWTRQKTKQAKKELKKVSELRKQEWASGKRVAIRDSKGRIMGTRMVAND